jgi:hypothetical protein
LEDGSPHITSVGGRYFSCDWDNITWKEYLNIKSGDVMSTQISENVYGDKSIIKVWRDAFL